MADPGFPIGGAPTHWGGANLQRVHFLAKTYVKMKEIDPVGGGMRRRRPLDPPMLIITNKWNTGNDMTIIVVDTSTKKI